MPCENRAMPASQLLVELERAGFLCNALAQVLKIAIKDQGSQKLRLVIDTAEDFLVDGENYYDELFPLTNQLPSQVFKHAFEKLKFEADDTDFLYQFLELIDVDLVGHDLDHNRRVSFGGSQTFQAYIEISPSVIEILGINVDLRK